MVLEKILESYPKNIAKIHRKVDIKLKDLNVNPFAEEFITIFMAQKTSAKQILFYNTTNNPNLKISKKCISI